MRRKETSNRLTIVELSSLCIVRLLASSNPLKVFHDSWLIFSDIWLIKISFGAKEKSSIHTNQLSNMILRKSSCDIKVWATSSTLVSIIFWISLSSFKSSFSLKIWSSKIIELTRGILSLKLNKFDNRYQLHLLCFLIFHGS